MKFEEVQRILGGRAFISAEHADAIRAATDGITHRELSEAERTTPQIREVFELLVMQHKNYGKFVIEDHKDWAMARQTCSGSKSYTVRYRAECADLLSWALAHGRRLLGGGSG